MDKKTLAETIRELGITMKSGADRFFLLNDADYAWFVATGYADVFSARLQDGKPAGTRSFFFDAGLGEILFGINYHKNDDGRPVENASGGVSASFSARAGGDERCLVAVPGPDTELIRISIDELKNLFTHDEFSEEMAMLTERWVSHLSQAISKDINPRTDQLIVPDISTKLPANLKIRAKKGTVWIEFLKGNALFLDMKEVAEPGNPCIFPVTQDSWLQTLEPCSIKTWSTREFCLRPDMWDRLNDFYETAFYCDFFNSRLFSVDEFNRLNEKSMNYKAVRNASLLKIASVLNDKIRKSGIDTGQDSMIAACRIVAESSGINISLPKQRKNEENTPLTFNEILRSSRFRARKVKCTGNWWKQNNGPLLGFTKEKNLPVALIPGSAGKYLYISPAENKHENLDGQNAATLLSEAFQFYRPFPDRPMTGYQLIRFGLKNCLHDILIVALVGLIGGILNLLVPVLTGAIFDYVIPASDYRQLYVFMMVIFMGTLAIVFFQMTRSFTMIRIETRLDFVLQSAVWDRLLNLPIPFFRDYPAGELTSRANSIMMLRKMLSDTVIYSVLGAIFMLFNFILLIYYDVQMALYIFAIMVISLIIIISAGKSIQKRQTIIIRLQNRIFGKLVQLLSSISKIRIAGAEIHAFSQWADSFSENKRTTAEVRKISLNITLLSNALPLIITVLVFGVIAGKLPDTMSTGSFMAFYTALMITITSFLQLTMAGISFYMAMPYLENLKPILETPPENAVIKPEIQHLSGEIEVSDVSFRYSENTPLVLRNVSMHIQPGEFVAIVGASGSGKSTLLRLLLGFETPESGSVYYDRQDIASVDPASVRRQAGTVLQQAQLSAGSIFTNITGITDATWDDAWEAARSVGLDEDIKQMPMGMHTVVTGGLSTLSGGQRQRIMIARAIVTKPRILFFDEATSALDNKTQQIVSQSLEKLQATRVVIAHRLSTVINADRIYLMENGMIAESGTYRELIEKNGKFKDLVRRQMIETH